MAFIIDNDLGSINIDVEIISRIAGLATMECYGIVGMAVKTVKDGFAQLLKRENLTKGISLTIDQNCEATIDLHIIVEYGTNIMAITDSVMTTVQYKVEEYTGLTVKEVNIYVEGIRV